MLRTLKQFTYLLQMIEENQKKPIFEWSSLIRASLQEIDEALRNRVISLEHDSEPISFEQFRNTMQRVARNLELAKRAHPITA